MSALRRQVFLGAVAAITAAWLLPSPVRAASVLSFDVNSISIQASTAFTGSTYTGNLVFSKDGDSTLAVGIDGVNQTGSLSGTFSNLTGTVSFLNGVPTGGNMTIQVHNADPLNPTDSYTFDIAPGDSVTRIGALRSAGLFGYQFDALTLHGLFNDANFGGVNVAPFYSSQLPTGLSGMVIEVKFAPNVDGFSGQSDVDMNVNAAVPLPSSAVAGVGLIGLLAVARRRRVVATV